MLISFVLRLSPAALAAGELAGEVEHVPSGDRGQFRDAADLCAWCARAGLPAPRSPESPVISLDPVATSPRKSTS